MLPVIGDPEALRPFLTYETSLVLGLAIIGAYAWSRFDRPAPALTGSPSPLFQALAPSAMGPGSVHGAAGAAYFAVLALVYLALCVVGTPGLFALIGLPIPDGGPASGLSETVGLAQQVGWDGPRTLEDASALVYSEMAPLTIALVLVGIGPVTPWLGKLEDRLRRVALGVAGLPDRLMDRAWRLQSTPFVQLKSKSDGQTDAVIADALPADATKLLQMVRSNLANSLELGTFEDDLVRVLAYHAWFTRGGVKFLRRSAAPAIVVRENDIAGRTDKARFELTGLVNDIASEKNGDISIHERRITEITRRIAALADDVCLMIALHEDHGLKAPKPSEDTAQRRKGENASSEDKDAPAKDESGAAQSAARRLLGEGRSSENPAFRATIWVHVTVVAVATAFFTGLVQPAPDLDEALAFPNWWTGLSAALSALFNIAPALLVALAVERGAAATSRDGTGSLGPADLVTSFFAAWAAALASLLALNVLLLILNPEVGLLRVLREKWSILPAALDAELPLAAAGAILAVWVLRAIRTARAGRLSGDGSAAEAVLGPGFWLTLQGGALFAALLVLDRYLTIRGSAARVGAELRDASELVAGADPQLWRVAGVGLAIGCLAMLSVVTTLLDGDSGLGGNEEDKHGAKRRGRGDPTAATGALLAAMLALDPSATRAEPLECAAEPSPGTIRIGVRTDAPPFASLDHDHKRYAGFFYDMCVEATQNAGLSSCVKPLTTAERRDVISGAAAGDFDLLCDPTTVTVARMRTLNIRFVPPEDTSTEKKQDCDQAPQACGSPPLWRFSQILFVGASGLVENNKAKPKSAAEAHKQDDCRPGELDLLGYARPKGDMRQSGVLEDYTLAYIEDTTSDELVTSRLDLIAESLHRHRQICAVPFVTYDEAAHSFCSGQARWIVGDMDILRAVFAQWSADNGGKVCLQTKSTFIQKEPYAILMSDRVRGFPEVMVQEIYELFSDEVKGHRMSSAKGALKTHVGEDARLSGLLEALFQINAVPPGVFEPHAPGGSAPGGAAEQKLSAAAVTKD